jgi:hypothetical protein
LRYEHVSKFLGNLIVSIKIKKYKLHVKYIVKTEKIERKLKNKNKN